MGTVKYSGPVASFHCPTNAEIRSLKVHFSPKQEGSGDPSPENIREIVGLDGVVVYQTGKNLYNPSTVTMNMEIGIDGLLIPTGASNNWCVSDFIPVKPNTTYTATALLTKGSGRCAVYDENKIKVSAKQETSGADAQTSIVTGNTGRYIRLTIRIGDGLNTILQEGSAAIPYEPYNGPTTNYEFGVLGKNKLDVSAYIDNEYVKSDGTFATNNSFRRTDYLHLPPGDYIYSSVKNDSVAAYIRVCGYTKDKTFVSMLNEQSKNSGNYAMTFTVPDNVYYIVLQSYKNTSQEQLELGSTATAYEPYDPNHTVYGGWVDLISGEVCEEYIAKDIGQINWNKSSSGNKFYIIGLSPSYPWQSDLTMYCSIYKFDGRNNGNIWYGDNYTIRYYYLLSGNSREIYIHDERYDNAQDFKTAMNGINLIYPLATPNTYHLAPTQLQTFLGQNNVWSNADYVEVEYDLHETQNILARKQFIMANQPHIVKPAAAPLQNFVTDVAAPLKECKIHFSPVQEGSGDPSPDNVRAISGWNSIQVGLPSEYQRVEWIKNPTSTTAHINTGILITNELQFEIDFQYDDNIAQRKYFMGQYSDTAFYLYVGTGSKALYFQTAFGTYWANTTLEMDADRHKFIYLFTDGALHVIDGTTDILNSPYTSASDKPIRIAGTVQGSSASCKTYGSKIWRNDILIQELIPCVRKADSKPGMYDTVSKTFYTNAGTGEFICGPDVNEPSLLIDWTNDVGTVYGGYLDLVKGEIVEEWHKIVADGVNIKCNSSYMTEDIIAAGIVYLNPVGKYSNYSIPNAVMDTIPTYTQNYANNHTITLPYATTTNAGNQYIVFKIANRADYPEVTDANTCKEFVNNWLQEHPTTIVYELKTPIIHTLTPTTLKALRGTNNIWSNSNGNIEVAYWSH